jgi:hypothetical protein
MASATLIVPPEPLAPSGKSDPRLTYSCPDCGHVLRVSGLGATVCTSSWITSGHTTL